MAGRRKKPSEDIDLPAAYPETPPAVELAEPAPAEEPWVESPADVSLKVDTSEPVPPADVWTPVADDPAPQEAAPADSAPVAAEEPLPTDDAVRDVPARDAEVPDEPTPLQPAPPPPPPAPRSNPLLPVLGGAVAAFFGFVLAQVVPQGWPLDATTRQIAQIETRVAELDRKLAGIAAPVADPALADRLTALEQRLDTLPAAGADPAALDALRAEIAALRDAAPPPAADLAPIEAELATLRAELAAIPRESGVAQELEALRAAAEAERAAAAARAEALRAESETLQAQAEATARAALARGAILRVQAALEAGGAFDVALADLGAAGVAVPPELATHADGLPLLAELQAGFPDAARAALAATTRPAEGAGLTDRLGAFLKGQTGLRSTAPRDGDDPDAVLSRAEAALRGGDLPATLAELDKLPPEAAPALADWRALADTRAAAAAALAALAADLDAK